MDNIKRNKLYFLLNPFAGNGNAYNVFKEAKKTLESHDIEVKYHLSLSSGDIQRFIIEEDLTDYDGICVVGGDGTIHEAVEGLMLSGKSQYLSLGVIPCGSGNAFAEDLELRDHGDAVEKIITGKTSLIDVMKVNSKENISYAVNIIGWGMASKVNILAEKMRWLGNIRYSIASIISILNIKPGLLNIIIEDQKLHEEAAFFIALNTIHTGKGMKMAPFAKLNDGLIDIVLLKKASKLRILKIFLQLFDGKHIDDSLVEYKQVKSFSIKTTNDLLNIDGENIGSTPIEVSVINNAIELYAEI